MICKNFFFITYLSHTLFPFNFFSLKHSSNTHQCIESSSSFCLESHAKKSSNRYIETISTFCTSSSLNSSYCSLWTVNTSTVSKCWNEKLPSENFAREFCCSDDESKSHPCCQNDCPLSFYNAKEIINTEEECECEIESENKNYCEKWNCHGKENREKNLDVNRVNNSSFRLNQMSYSSYSSLSSIENSNFVTYTTDLSSSFSCIKSDSSTCLEWQGSSKSVARTVLSSCSCTSENCQEWICNQKSIDYIWPNVLWSIFTIIFSIFPLVFYNFIIEKDFSKLVLNKSAVLKNFLTFLIIFILWSSIFFFIGIWLGGFSIFFISLLILIPCIFILYSKLFFVTFCSSLKNKTSISPEMIQPDIININNNMIKVAQANLILKNYASVEAIYIDENKLENDKEDEEIEFQNSRISLDSLPVAYLINDPNDDTYYADLV